MLYITRRCHAAPKGAAASVSISALVHSYQRTAPYLRHAPPTLYLTVDGPTGDAEESANHTPMRHSARLLDSAGTYDSVSAAIASSASASTASPSHSPASPTLQSHGVYLLTSTALADVGFTDTSKLRSVLVGLPRVRNAIEARAFVSAHQEKLAHVKKVLLPEVGSGGAGHAIRAMREALPGITFYGSSFAQAFLTDVNFFDGVRRTLLANTLTRAEAVPFAEVPADCFVCVQDAQRVDQCCGRVLTAYVVRDAAHEARAKRTRRQHPPHFTNELVLFHDSAFDAVMVGSALWRLPWLPTLMPEVNRDIILPAAPLLAAKCAAEGATAPLLTTWRPTEAAEAIRKALQRVPSAHHVWTETFGEPSIGSAGAVADAVTESARQLEALRSRLAVRLETDTGRDVTVWRRRLLDRVVREVLSTKTASQPTNDATRAAFASWALDDDINTSGDRDGLGALATALTQSALSLPPTAQPAAAATGATTAAKTSRNSQRGWRLRGDGESSAGAATSDLEGDRGVSLMQDLLARKGLGGLQSVVKREEIDVAVFLAMSADDLQRVFRATFGVTKKLELLQLEVREKLEPCSEE